eukprot:12916630-Prorocentrum_lima.AAC.1
MDTAGGPPAVSMSASSSAGTPMATTLPVSKPHSRSTGKKASREPPPKKQEATKHDDAVSYTHLRAHETR